ncbi:MAG: MBOAT family protein [Bacteroidetes bacterium]|nr:MBOAT family protein [Bacteroidota bacterium]
MASILIEFYLVNYMSAAEGRRRKFFLTLSLILNLGLLVYFKYANFFIENLDAILNSFGLKSVLWTKIALPIGISFFTFQKITYTVDVYRKIHAPLKKVWDYAFYILMFPHLIAGPIVRFNLIADQIEDRGYNETIDNRLTGLFRFTIGLAKKVLIANVLGEQVDRIFALSGGDLTSSTAWIGIVAYAFQIYYDFSGYSDMTIGLARMIGFDFPENFNNPYISQSITEFWRRWHMTLGRFMKDYLYIPLGGNKVSTARLYFNLWVVFLLSGLWHGAAWNFVLWGAYQGVFLVADRLFLVRFYNRIGKIPSMTITFFIILIGWVFFRANTLDHAWMYLKTMFNFNFSNTGMSFDARFWTMMVFAVIFAFWAAFSKIEKWQEIIFGKIQKNSTIITMVVASFILFIISLSAITSTGFNPFIYFRF